MNRVINSVMAAFWILLCLNALFALGNGPLALNIARIAFVSISVAHILRLLYRISFTAYVVAESIAPAKQISV